MEINYSKEKKTLTVLLTEEIDQHEADRIRRIVDDEIERFIPREVVFDFDNISFMDSSGIGMIIGRYKLIKLLGGDCIVINVGKSVKKIFEMSGLTRLMEIKDKDVIDRSIENTVYLKKKEIENQIMISLNKEDEDEGII